MLRDGTTHTFHLPAEKQGTIVPTILEGELVGDDQGITVGLFSDGDVFFAYDCLTTPTVNYARCGRYRTRYAAMMAILCRLRALGCCCCYKPIFDMAPHPHQALQQCLEWSKKANVPCDGVVLISDTIIAPVLFLLRFAEKGLSMICFSQAIVEGEAHPHYRFCGVLGI